MSGAREWLKSREPPEPPRATSTLPENPLTREQYQAILSARHSEHIRTLAASTARLKQHFADVREKQRKEEENRRWGPRSRPPTRV